MKKLWKGWLWVCKKFTDMHTRAAADWIIRQKIAEINLGSKLPIQVTDANLYLFIIQSKESPLDIKTITAVERKTNELPELLKIAEGIGRVMYHISIRDLRANALKALKENDIWKAQ